MSMGVGLSKEQSSRDIVFRMRGIHRQPSYIVDSDIIISRGWGPEVEGIGIIAIKRDSVGSEQTLVPLQLGQKVSFCKVPPPPSWL